MAIVVETIATTAMGGGSIITKPVGLVAGDLLLAIVADDQYDYGALGAPAGWTTFGRYASDDVNKRVEVLVCYKVATSTETAASDFTFTNASGGILYRISGSEPTLMSIGTGAVYSGQNLVIVVGASGDNDSDYATFSGYSVSGGDSPSFTERFDSYNPAGFRESLGVADAVYNSISDITSYGITITEVGGSDGTISFLLKIPAVQNASATNVLHQSSLVVFPTLTGSTQSVSNQLFESSPNIIGSTITTRSNEWQNETSNPTTWTNETI